MTTGDKGCSKVSMTTVINSVNYPSTSAIDLIVSKNNTTTNLVPDVNVTGRIVFKGDDTSVNNYIELYENGSAQLYRIISIESDGTLKVIRDVKITEMAWDSANYDLTAGARYNDMNTYCGLYSDGRYLGCNAWRAITGTYTNGSIRGTVNQDSTMMQYLNNTFYSTLDESTKEVIVNKDWDIGLISSGSTVVNAQTQAERDKWVGKIGLMNVMNWFNASLVDGCQAPSYGSNTTCSGSNYLFKGSYEWTISPQANNSGFVFFVTSVGGFRNYIALDSSDALPEFYLTSNIQLSGEGTSTSPFKIS